VIEPPPAVPPASAAPPAIPALAPAQILPASRARPTATRRLPGSAKWVLAAAAILLASIVAFGLHPKPDARQASAAAPALLPLDPKPVCSSSRYVAASARAGTCRAIRELACDRVHVSLARSCREEGAPDQPALARSTRGTFCSESESWLLSDRTGPQDGSRGSYPAPADRAPPGPAARYLYPKLRRISPGPEARSFATSRMFRLPGALILGRDRGRGRG